MVLEPRRLRQEGFHESEAAWLSSEELDRTNMRFCLKDKPNNKSIILHSN